MIRGTTSEITLEIEGLSSLSLTELWLTIASLGTEIKKTMDDLTIDGNTIKYKLTQSESLSLKGSKGFVQVDMLTADGDRLSSEIETFSIEKVLRNEVMSVDED